MLNAGGRQTSPGRRDKDLGERRHLRRSVRCEIGGAGVGGRQEEITDTTSTVTQRRIKGCKQIKESLVTRKGKRLLLMVSIFLFFF